MVSSVKIVRRTYRYLHPDGSTSCQTVLQCPHQGCGIELEDFQGLVSHALEQHDLKLLSSKSWTGEIPQTINNLPSTSQKVTRLRLPEGEIRLVCPDCQRHFLDEASLLEHIAAIHGRALSVPGSRFGGQSDQLDLLHSCSEEKHPRCDEILEHLQLVSLGSFCGMKLSMQRLCLGTAHLPFDWIRSTQAGVERFLKTGFSEFFCVARKLEIKSAALTVHRGEHHSFWHDDVGQAVVRDKLRRRILRFLDLANGFRTQSRDVLFLRSCACSSELHHAEDLYAALAQCFTSGHENSPRVLLAIIVDGQVQRQGPIRHASLPGLVFFTQEQLSEEDGADSQAYCWAIGAACDAALWDCAQGFAVQPGQRVVKSGTELADGGYCGGEWYPPLQFCEAGLHSGYGVSCFEAPGAAHLDLDADRGRDMDTRASEHKNMLLTATSSVQSECCKGTRPPRTRNLNSEEQRKPPKQAQGPEDPKILNWNLEPTARRNRNRYSPK
ncbi:unnamed protein product [Symbiodinium sp. CCMP2456]|nr:unnamed protein product [Symbiodinium sp. CCMP2456]